MRNSGFIWLVVVLMAILDIYIFQAVKLVSNQSSSRVKIIICSIYWFLSVSAIVLVLILPYINSESWNKSVRNYVLATVIGLFLAKLMAGLFFLIDDVRRAITWLVMRISGNDLVPVSPDASAISRSVFFSWLGVAAGASLFGSLLYGFSNKYNYRIKNVKLTFKNLPASFKGFKIVQISDVHSGSFTNKEAVNHGIDLILQQKADLILFTGDLVNDKAVEMVDYMDVFNRLSAPHGVYSTLGNHDYGDYAWGVNPQGQDAIDKANNLIRLKEVHKELGWRLLMNEHVPITKNGESFALIGIENWGAKANFPKYGKMSEAYPGAEKYAFKILMSHDPSHWDGEVRPKYGDIDLMLAGHTHGMQFGIETPWFKWSPVQWVYKQWAGLYKNENQYLYVNRGYGFIGYPGRVGVLPEITVIELA